MENNPFTSQYSNVYNESLYRIVPNPYGLNNVTGTQIQNRNVYDSSKITVQPNHANPQQQQISQQTQQCANCPPPQICTIREQIPGGVSFTFNSPPKTYAVQNCSAPNQTYNPGPQIIQQCVHPQLHYSNKPCMANQYMQNQTQLDPSQRENAENMIIPQLKQNPYKLNFHYNGQTSTSDLLSGPNQIQSSMGTPDYTNLAGVINTLRDDIEAQFPIVVQKSTKIFLLTKSPDIKQTSEGIREQDKMVTVEYVDKQLQTDRKVSFEEDPGNAENPATKSKKKTTKRRKKKTKRSSRTGTKCKDRLSNESSSDTLSDSDDKADTDDYEDADDKSNDHK